jgi:hypothetical protein
MIGSSYLIYLVLFNWLFLFVKSETFSPFASGIADGTQVTSVTVDAASGDMFIGGDFSGGVKKWDGSWQALGTGVNGVVSDVDFKNDTLYLSGL